MSPKGDPERLVLKPNSGRKKFYWPTVTLILDGEFEPMPPKFDPTTPIDAYKGIIDQLVDETSNGVSERLLRESGVYSKAPGESAANEFVKSLTERQRELLATMLRQERVGAIHDVLATLTWWLRCREVGLTFRGKAMPFELSGMGMHGDYIGRLDDWEWPSENQPD